MKHRATKARVRAMYSNLILVGYCDLQNLLVYEDPEFYTTRREGWGADVYDFGRDAIVTGYDPFGNIRPSYEMRRKYDDAARSIRTNYGLSYEVQKEKIDELLRQFIAEAKGEPA